MNLETELILLKKEINSPFEHLARRAKLLLEIEMKLLHESTDREALLALKAQKLTEIEILNKKLNETEEMRTDEQTGTETLYREKNSINSFSK